ncbi:MAG: DUF1987 domain-containing protein [Bacteroidota bacterium]|nr:DUF1987 domain-containing protein [Bacteroidota bacterium]
MQKPLKLKETEDTPQVVFDISKNEFKISGKSLPEDPAEFYEPIIAWVSTYIKKPNPITEFKINIEYFNSGSVKQIMVLLTMLEEIISTGNKIKIIWYYDKNDDLMEIKGNEFKNMLTIPFELTVC